MHNLENSVAITVGSTLGVLLIAVPAAFALTVFALKTSSISSSGF